MNPSGHDTWTPEQRKEYREKIETAKAKAAEQRKQEYEQAARKASLLWESATPALEDHPYLVRKQIKPHGVKQIRTEGLKETVPGRLTIPIYDQSGKIISLQFIPPGVDDKKKFLPGGKVSGGFYIIGGDDFSNGGFICEGWATGCSIHEATGKPVVVAFSSWNLSAVAGHFKKYPLIICADNDLATAEKIGKNPGLDAAKKAAEKSGLPYIVSPVDSDFNDLHVSQSLDAVLESIESQKPKTIQEYHEIIESKDGEKDAEYLTAELVESIKKSGLPEPLKYQLLKKISKKCNIKVEYLKDSKQNNDDAPGASQIATILELVAGIGHDNVLFSLESNWIWDVKGVWRRLDDRNVKVWIQEKLKESGGDDITQNLVNSMLDLFKTEIFKPNHKFNVNQDSINVLNGELHWTGEAWELKPHCKKSYRTTQLPVSYGTAETSPQFENFLMESFAPDPDKIEKAIIILEMLGYCLLSTANREKFFMLVGPGANGKSVLLSVLVALLGPENVSAVMPMQLDNKFQRAHLLGKLANVVTELSEGTMLPDAAMKSITSGEKMTAEDKFKPPFDFEPFSTLIFATNHLPHTRDFSEALFRRAIIIPFNRVFSEKEQDKNLTSKLKTELPGILNLALEAITGVFKRGYFTEAGSVNEMKKQWRLEADQAAQFLDECCVKEPGSSELSKDLYAAYRVWAIDQGIGKLLNQNNFSKRLKVLGAVDDRGTGGQRKMAGFRVRQEFKPVTQVTQVTRIPSSFCHH
ncbi:MAG: phage/plasmid primase, P4 family [Desulfosalsimonadaceae bacterium]